MSENNMELRSFDTSTSAAAQEHFNLCANQLESLIDQRDRDVRTAMSQYQADGVSEEYQAKEVRWHNVADQVKLIIRTLRTSLSNNDASAISAQQRAQAAVDAIG